MMQFPFFVLPVFVGILSGFGVMSKNLTYVVGFPPVNDTPTTNHTIHLGTTLWPCDVIATDLSNNQVYLDETMPVDTLNVIVVNNSVLYRDYFRPVLLVTNDSLYVAVVSHLPKTADHVDVFNSHPIFPQDEDVNFILTVPPLIKCLMLISGDSPAGVLIMPRGFENWEHFIELESYLGYYWSRPETSRSGVVVKSSSAISVVAGFTMSRASIPSTGAWGVSFIGVSTSQGEENLDVVYIYNQKHPNNVVIGTREDRPIKMYIEPDELFKRVDIEDSPGAFFIHSEKPIAVSVSMSRRQALAVLIPMSQWTSSYYFQTFDGGNEDGDCELLLIVKKSMELSLRINDDIPRYHWHHVPHSDPPHSFVVVPVRCRTLYSVNLKRPKLDEPRQSAFGCYHVGKGRGNHYFTYAGSLYRSSKTHYFHKVDEWEKLDKQPNMTLCNSDGEQCITQVPAPIAQAIKDPNERGPYAEEVSPKPKRDLVIDDFEDVFKPLNRWAMPYLTVLIVVCIIFFLSVVTIVYCCYRLAFESKTREDYDTAENRPHRVSVQQRRAVNWLTDFSIRDNLSDTYNSRTGPGTKWSVDRTTGSVVGHDVNSMASDDDTDRIQLSTYIT